MSWKSHITREYPERPIDQTYQVDDEMRQAIVSYIEEYYGGVVLLCCKFDEIGENYCKYTLNLSSNAWIEFYFHNTGLVEGTLCTDFTKPVRRIPLPKGQLGPDNEEFSAMVARETADTWRKQPVGWHPAHDQILNVMKDYVRRNHTANAMMVGGFYPDGTETLSMGRTFDLTPQGLRDALCEMRAGLKGGQAWQETYIGEQDDGHFSIMLLPGRNGPPDDNAYFYLDGKSGYTTLASNIDDHRWENVLPM